MKNEIVSPEELKRIQSRQFREVQKTLIEVVLEEQGACTVRQIRDGLVDRGIGYRINRIYKIVSSLCEELRVRPVGNVNGKDGRHPRLYEKVKE